MDYYQQRAFRRDPMEVPPAERIVSQTMMRLISGWQAHWRPDVPRFEMQQESWIDSACEVAL
jgi:hypothetical protein